MCVRGRDVSIFLGFGFCFIEFFGGYLFFVFVLLVL